MHPTSLRLGLQPPYDGLGGTSGAAGDPSPNPALAEPPLAFVSCLDFPHPVAMQAHVWERLRPPHGESWGARLLQDPAPGSGTGCCWGVWAPPRQPHCWDRRRHPRRRCSSRRQLGDRVRHLRHALSSAPCRCDGGCSTGGGARAGRAWPSAPASSPGAAPDPVHAEIVPVVRTPVPAPPPQRPASARVRARENPLFSTALSRAAHLKAVRLGGCAAPPLPSAASAPLSDLELHALGDGRDLDTTVMAALTAACAAVSLGAP